MEVVLEDISYNNFDKLNLRIKSNIITGICGDNYEDILKILSADDKYIGKLFAGNVLVKKNTDDYKRMISVVTKNFSYQTFLNTVEEYIAFVIKYNKIKCTKKTVCDLLEKIGLNSDYLDKDISKLSSSEVKFLQLVVSNLTNPKILILEDPFTNLDKSNEKKLITFLNYLIDEKKCTVIIFSNDSEILYKYTKQIVLLKSGQIFSEGNTKEVYRNVDKLLSSGFEVPDIVLFVYKAISNKGAKIKYHTDIRDLIKDVYKNV